MCAQFDGNKKISWKHLERVAGGRLRACSYVVYLEVLFACNSTAEI